MTPRHPGSRVHAIAVERSLARSWPAVFWPCLFMAAAIALGARFSFRLFFTDVPVSLQTLAVLLAGGWLGSRAGAASVAGYLISGVMGAPVFAGGMAGPAVLAGPTGGYLIGFLPAAFLVGKVVERRAPSWIVAGALIGGTLVIEMSGAAWLHYGHARPWAMVLETGVLPFLAADLGKAVVAWIILRRSG